MNQYIRRVNDVHQEISEEAASIANAEVKRLGLMKFGAYGPFTVTPNKLSLTINEFITNVELLQGLQEIGRRAMKQALVERPDLTVGLIIGFARKGQNYFDRFK